MQITEHFSSTDHTGIYFNQHILVSRTVQVYITEDKKWFHLVL